MKIIIYIVAVLILTSCSTKDESDPLKYTKQLAIKGHTSLYNNGMLEIPYTTVKLIPAAADTTDFAGKLFFQDAKAALKQGLKDAVNSVYIIPKGTKKAYEFSKDVYRVSTELSDDIRKYTRGQGTILIDKSSSFAKKHIVGSLSSAYQTGKDVYAKGDEVKEYFDIASSKIIDSYSKRRKKVFDISIAINKTSTQWAKEDFKFAQDSFVTGYIMLPKQLSQNLDTAKQSFTSFKEAYESAESHREESSLYFTDILSDAVSNYTKNTSSSFSKASKDFGKHIEEEGFVLTSLKSMRWVLQAVFYDGLIKPVSKLAVGTIGFISVNGVIYPVEILAGETKATVMVMVEVSTQTLKSTYEIVAPSMTFALASILSTTEYFGGKALASATAVTEAAVGAIDATASAAAAVTTKVGGVVASTGVKYIGVPLAVSTRTLGEVSYGVLASTTSTVAASGVFVAGETVALGTHGAGTVASGTTLVAGTAYSVASAAIQGVYHISEATILPAGYTLASGTVLGYGSITQLQAHTVLAASDAAYLVLSLEGPKWVLYSISGSSIKGDKALPAGAVVDLKKMHENNETIKKIEVSDEEIQKILESLDKDLPTY